MVLAAISGIEVTKFIGQLALRKERDNGRRVPKQDMARVCAEVADKRGDPSL
jgi:hypothetical protein